jgi:hypothetical protein
MTPRFSVLRTIPRCLLLGFTLLGAAGTSLRAQVVTTLLSPSYTAGPDTDSSSSDSSAVTKTFVFNSSTGVMSNVANSPGFVAFRFLAADQSSFMSSNAQITSWNATSQPISTTLLTAGATVDSSLSWTYTHTLTNSAANLSAGYVGIRWDAGSGNYNYGYAQFSTGAALGSLGPSTFTIIGGAFERSLNTAITVANVSAIPEPSTYAAFAGAAVLGLAVWRRRRAA